MPVLYWKGASGKRQTCIDCATFIQAHLAAMRLMQVAAGVASKLHVRIGIAYGTLQNIHMGSVRAAEDNTRMDHDVIEGKAVEWAEDMERACTLDAKVKGTTDEESFDVSLEDHQTLTIDGLRRVSTIREQMMKANTAVLFQMAPSWDLPSRAKQRSPSRKSRLVAQKANILKAKRGSMVMFTCDKAIEPIEGATISTARVGGHLVASSVMILCHHYATPQRCIDIFGPAVNVAARFVENDEAPAGKGILYLVRAVADGEVGAAAAGVERYNLEAIRAGAKNKIVEVVRRDG